MIHELSYFLKINVAIALFYGFYRLLFYKDTFFAWRRVALLSFLLISAVYPFFNIQDWIRSQEPMVAMADIYASFVSLDPKTIANTAITALSWKSISLFILYGCYIAVVAFLLLRFGIQLFYIIKLAVQTPTQYLHGVKVHLLPKAEGPFSFMHWIFIHPSAHQEEEISEILTHEQTHVQQWHSIDILISELFCILCWFNPFVWLIKREIRCNLEFMADNHVLKQGYDCKVYQYHLLGLAHQKTVNPLSNSFNMLPLKNRIQMMNKKRTQQVKRTKYLIFIPVIAILLITSNIEAVARTAKKIAIHMETLPETIEPTHKFIPHVKPPIEETADDNETVFEVVEQMPEYPGGQRALMEFFSRNIKYPIEAQKAGTQGRVIVQFVVDKDGIVKEPVVVRSISTELDSEAVRVVNSMPKWAPGKQRGQAVRVKYTVPVMFRLES